VAVAVQEALLTAIGAPDVPVKFELAARIVRIQFSDFLGFSMVTVAMISLLPGMTGWAEGLMPANVTLDVADTLTPWAQAAGTAARTISPINRLRIWNTQCYCAEIVNVRGRV
jgi:hypothetical protein